jgi:hypothetical protein
VAIGQLETAIATAATNSQIGSLMREPGRRQASGSRPFLQSGLYLLARTWSKVFFVRFVSDCEPMSGSFVHNFILAGCRRSAGLLPSGPHKRGTMPNDQLPASTPSTTGLRKGFGLAVLLGGLAVLVVVVAVLRTSDPESSVPPEPTVSRAAETTATTIGERDRVVARLREILRIRDRAYRNRDVSLLRKIYTADCPCLRGDEGAIRQLLKEDAVWVGSSTSVRVEKIDKESDRLWIVEAIFAGSPFRIETESGDLIRAVEEQRELFRFALVKAVDDGLLLGIAAPVDDSD